MGREATVSLDDATPAEIAEKVKQLDPTGRYRVVIGRRRSRDEIVADMDALFGKAVEDPVVSGLSDDEIMALVIDEIDRNRREEAERKQSGG